MFSFVYLLFVSDLMTVFVFFVQCQSPSLLEVNVQTLLCAANLIPLGLLINSFASHVEAGVKAKAIADLVPTTVEGCRTAADNKQPSSAELLYNTLGSHIKPIVQKIQETLQLEAILNRSNTESDESESKKHENPAFDLTLASIAKFKDVVTEQLRRVLESIQKDVSKSQDLLLKFMGAEVLKKVSFAMTALPTPQQMGQASKCLIANQFLYICH